MELPSTRAHPHRLALFCAWLLVMFLVLFPKGGFKVGEIPVTWGYLLLGFLAGPLLVFRLLATKLRFSVVNLAALATLVPFQLLFVYAGKFYGVQSLGLAMSTAISVFFLPLMFLVILPGFLIYVDGVRLSRYLRISLLLTALWGILLFVWHPITGHFIEIPYLTVNAGDYGEIEKTKHIARGFFLKLISTYNNGNVYGASLITILPLYVRLEPSRWKRNTVKLALFLTLSRTVWAGLVINEVATALAVLADQVSTFPRLHLKRVGKQLVMIGMTIVAVFPVLLLNANTLAFLLDPTAGGRSGEVSEVTSHLTLLPAQALQGFASEVAYAAAAKGWGIAGFLAFTLIMVGPLLLVGLDRGILQQPLRRAALKGLMLYAFVSLSDGAYNYIPTQAFYFFAYMILVFGWPKPHGAPVRRDAAPSLVEAPV